MFGYTSPDVNDTGCSTELHSGVVYQYLIKHLTDFWKKNDFGRNGGTDIYFDQWRHFIYSIFIVHFIFKINESKANVDETSFSQIGSNEDSWSGALNVNSCASMLCCFSVDKGFLFILLPQEWGLSLPLCCLWYCFHLLLSVTWRFGFWSWLEFLWPKQHLIILQLPHTSDL